MAKSAYSTNYSELLKDPRWQKLRLEIMQRDDFACVACGNDESTLHVHHCYYEYGEAPWQYPHSSLLTLCKNCHDIETENIKSAKSSFINDFSAQGLLAEDFSDISLSIQENSECTFFKDLPSRCALAWLFRSPEAVRVVLDMYWSDKSSKATRRRHD